jgi:hypothetical protein
MCDTTPSTQGSDQPFLGWDMTTDHEDPIGGTEGRGSSVRAPVWQVQGLEFKPPVLPKKKKKDHGAWGCGKRPGRGAGV